MKHIIRNNGTVAVVATNYFISSYYYEYGTVSTKSSTKTHPVSLIRSDCGANIAEVSAITQRLLRLTDRSLLPLKKGSTAFLVD